MICLSVSFMLGFMYVVVCSYYPEQWKIYLLELKSDVIASIDPSVNVCKCKSKLQLKNRLNDTLDRKVSDQMIRAEVRMRYR